MTEDFLHYVWQYQQFDKTNLFSVENKRVSIIKVGQRNFDAGPDFSNARIEIDGVLWAGQVEIHLNSGDWLNHQHQTDSAYENVILHVVWEHTLDIRRKDGTLIPTLELKNLVFKNTIDNYHFLISNKKEIACENSFRTSSDIAKLSMLDKALANRLEKKAKEIQIILDKNKQDWEETCYQVFARNLGFKLNSLAFFRLSEILPLKILKKHQGNIFQIEALCYGQAGFLENPIDEYAVQLAAEYQYLSAKYEIENLRMSKHEWKYLRTRPSNFPSVRISQFAAMVNLTKGFLLDLVLNATRDSLHKLLSDPPSEYWQKHYDFGKKSKVELKGIGRMSIENILINTTVNLLATYSISTGSNEYFEKAVKILEELSPEKNTITEKWNKLGMKVSSSFDSQALIEQFNEYCSKKRCLECTIGTSILRAK